MLDYVLLAVGLGVAALAIVAARKPSHFAFTRSIVIAAPPDRVWPLIADLRAMNTWNPFATDDPASSFTYSEPATGPGASYTWAGGKMGSGAFAVRAATPPQRLDCTLHMVKPIASESDVVFSLTPHAAGTQVTWSISGERRFAHKVMHTIINPDRMMGGMFDKGLAGLKAKAEAPSA